MSIDTYKCQSTVISVDHITVEVKKKRGTFDGSNKPPYLKDNAGPFYLYDDGENKNKLHFCLNTSHD